ncbi:hypothetical protein EJ07DRAFT_172684 [Lizonia empirigonia]|nr:hypothetical protein EJ07DRAFT_172684 [Lizonia empirigonia]
MYRRFFECESSHIDSDVSNQHFQFALHQSNKAIQQLVKQQAGDYQTSVTDKLTVMTCCVLFGSMANLQGQQQAALDHLRIGIRMLRETKPQSYNDRNCYPVNIYLLRSIFTGLDIQARSSISWSDIQDWEPVVSSMRASEPADIDVSSPWAASELFCRLETLLNDTLAFNQGCCEHNTLVSRFHLASNNLATLHSTSSSGSPHPPIRGDLLLLLYQTHHWLRSSISPLKRHFSIPSSLSSTPYDPTAHFTTMMHHATHLLSQTPAGTPIYSTAPGALSALWPVATSAPTSCVALRKRAITLLLSHPRREGMFDGRLAGRIGQAAWRLEQRAVRRELGLPGCCDEDRESGADAHLLIPEHLRIVHMDVEYPEGEVCRARVWLASAAEVERGGGTVVEIDW